MCFASFGFLTRSSNFHRRLGRTGLQFGSCLQEWGRFQHHWLAFVSLYHHQNLKILCHHLPLSCCLQLYFCRFTRLAELARENLCCFLTCRESEVSLDESSPQDHCCWFCRARNSDRLPSQCSWVTLVAVSNLLLHSSHLNITDRHCFPAPSCNDDSASFLFS